MVTCGKLLQFIKAQRSIQCILIVCIVIGVVAVLAIVPFFLFPGIRYQEPAASCAGNASVSQTVATTTQTSTTSHSKLPSSHTSTEDPSSSTAVVTIAQSSTETATAESTTTSRVCPEFFSTMECDVSPDSGFSRVCEFALAHVLISGKVIQFTIRPALWAEKRGTTLLNYFADNATEAALGRRNLVRSNQEQAPNPTDISLLPV
ncbi:hypothetical protein PRIPAC_95362 [Pristionchus pacificus]|uniref:Uncharacterized protein n=1 Tax=Pristionchus pacificus TaxID=54126 RepID=A0A2A6B304_PRIPA|nr:hypothetical protein PRIPAC_95362 [Pristionchus pacificus]|eukprot:PDM60259.1 hypothetical protein PRIPAC_54084 [Pristionchus pacificus]